MNEIMPAGYCPNPGCDYILDKERTDLGWVLMQSSRDHLTEHKASS